MAVAAGLDLAEDGVAWDVYKSLSELWDRDNAAIYNRALNDDPKAVAARFRELAAALPADGALTVTPGRETP